MTNRNEEILRFINEFGFVALRHLMQRFSLKKSNCYKIIKRLMNADLIYYERIYHNQKGVYTVTEKGAEWTDLPPLNKISEFRYKHNLKVVDVYLALKKKLPDANWISERKIIKAEYTKKKDQKKHLPDAYLILPNFEKVGIEVELTLKDEARLLKIFKYYGGHESIEEAWYYCAPGIINYLSSLAKNKPYIKIHSLEGLCDEQSI